MASPPALVYFNKSVDELSVSEAAFLAARSRATNYDPAAIMTLPRPATMSSTHGQDRRHHRGRGARGRGRADRAEEARRDPVFSRPISPKRSGELIQRFGEDKVYKSAVGPDSLDPILQSYATSRCATGW